MRRPGALLHLVAEVVEITVSSANTFVLAVRPLSPRAANDAVTAFAIGPDAT